MTWRFGWGVVLVALVMPAKAQEHSPDFPTEIQNTLLRTDNLDLHQYYRLGRLYCKCFSGDLRFELVSIFDVSSTKEPVFGFQIAVRPFGTKYRKYRRACLLDEDEAAGVLQALETMPFASREAATRIGGTFYLKYSTRDYCTIEMLNNGHRTQVYVSADVFQTYKCRLKPKALFRLKGWIERGLRKTSQLSTYQTSTPSHQ